MGDDRQDLEVVASRLSMRPVGIVARIRRGAQMLRYYRTSQIARRLAKMAAGRFCPRRTPPVRVPANLALREAALGQFSIIAQPIRPQCDGSSAQCADALKQGRITLLDEQYELGQPLDWQAPSVATASHLWRFHLHYHEYLLDIALGVRDGDVDPDTWKLIWRTIDSWITAHPDSDAGADAWHPFCISRRLPVWLLLLSQQQPDSPLRNRMLTSIYQQTEFLSANLEFDLGGNHLLENLTALALAAAALDTPRASTWIEQSERYHRRELPQQVLAHGEHFERSPMYHCQVLGNLLRVAIVSQSLNPSLAEYCLETAKPMLGFLAAIVHPDGEIPLLGDSGFGEAHNVVEIEAWAKAAGILSTGLLLTPDRLEAYPTSPGPETAPRRKDDGAHVVGNAYWIWRSGGDAILFDTGAVAADALPAHGHCDLLGLEASIDGARWIVDSGNFDYDDSTMRRYCRSSLAHNGVTVDDQNQCDVWSKFRMGYRGRPTTVKQGSIDGVTWCLAGHDGYRNIGCSVTRLVAILASGQWVCVERVGGARDRMVTGRLHFHPEVRVERSGKGHLLLQRGAVTRRLVLIDVADLSLAQGWYCPRFGQRQRTTVVVYAPPPPGGVRLFGWMLEPVDSTMRVALRAGDGPAFDLGQRADEVTVTM